MSAKYLYFYLYSCNLYSYLWHVSLFQFKFVIPSLAVQLTWWIIQYIRWLATVYRCDGRMQTASVTATEGISNCSSQVSWPQTGTALVYNIPSLILNRYAVGPCLPFASGQRRQRRLAFITAR